MTLPTFLGIGVPRSGSTWMASLLENHPEAYIAPGKEIFFFNRYYHRGVEWYEKLFPTETEAAHYQAIGEFTPEYIYCLLCPERIAALPSITKFILCLRNPIERAYSHYGLRVRSSNYRKSFEDFLTPDILEMGFYSHGIKNYLKYFDREQILILIFEQTIATNTPKTKATIAQFLNLDLMRFSRTAGTKGVNPSYIPRARLAYDVYARLMQLLLKLDQHRFVKTVRQLHLEKYFGKASSLPPMRRETRRHLQTIYQEEIHTLENVLKLDLSCWRETNI